MPTQQNLRIKLLVVDDRGAPVSGATVRVPMHAVAKREGHETSISFHKDLQNSQTNERGEFEFEHPDRDVWMGLLVEKAGVGRSGIPARPIREFVDRENRLRLEPRSVRGRVSDENNQPVAAAQVMAGLEMRVPLTSTSSGTFTLFPCVTSTSADGTFELTEVPAGRVRFSVSKDGYRLDPKGTLIEIAPGEPVPALAFAMRSVPIVQGRVIDAEGRPIANATLRLNSSAEFDQYSPDVKTDALGQFTSRGFRSEWITGSASAEGFHTKEISLLRAGGAPVDIVLGTAKRGDVNPTPTSPGASATDSATTPGSVNVNGPTGAGFSRAGSTVSGYVGPTPPPGARPREPVLRRSKADRPSKSWLASRTEQILSGDAFRSAPAGPAAAPPAAVGGPPNPTPTSSTPFVPVGSAPSLISGRIVVPGSLFGANPCVGARVSWAPAWDSGDLYKSGGPPRTIEALTDEDGAFTLGPVEPGLQRIRFVPASGAADFVQYVAVPGSGTEVRLGDLQAQPESVLLGRATLDGKPVANARVHCSAYAQVGGFQSQQTTTAADGTFRFEKLTAGCYYVTLLRDGGASWTRDACVELRSELTVDFPLGSQAIRARILKQQQPIYATVGFSRTDLRSYERQPGTIGPLRGSLRTDTPADDLLIDGLSPGTWQFTIRDVLTKHWRTHREDLEIAPGNIGPVAHDFMLTEGLVVCGVVLDSAGMPVEDAIVEIVDPAEPDAPPNPKSPTYCLSGPAGDFVFLSLDPGTYAIRALRADVPARAMIENVEVAPELPRPDVRLQFAPLPALTPLPTR